jgi:hypothetical protein
MSEHVTDDRERRVFQGQEIVVYPDDSANLRFDKQGTIIQWGKHNRIAVTTASGNRYFIGDGIVVNEQTRGAYLLDGKTRDVPDFEVGKPLVMPGIATTTAVRSVEAQYKVGWQGGADVREDVENPFVAGNFMIDYVIEQLESTQK